MSKDALRSVPSDPQAVTVKSPCARRPRGRAFSVKNASIATLALLVALLDSTPARAHGRSVRMGVKSGMANEEKSNSIHGSTTGAANQNTTGSTSGGSSTGTEGSGRTSSFHMMRLPKDPDFVGASSNRGNANRANGGLISKGSTEVGPAHVGSTAPSGPAAGHAGAARGGS